MSLWRVPLVPLQNFGSMFFGQCHQCHSKISEACFLDSATSATPKFWKNVFLESATTNFQKHVFLQSTTSATLKIRKLFFLQSATSATQKFRKHVFLESATSATPKFRNMSFCRVPLVPPLIFLLNRLTYKKVQYQYLHHRFKTFLMKAVFKYFQPLRKTFCCFEIKQKTYINLLMVIEIIQALKLPKHTDSIKINRPDHKIHTVCTVLLARFIAI